MTKLFTMNSKMKKTGDAIGVRLINFGIPAFKSKSGLATCPMAGDCAKGCYATQGAYAWGNVAQAFEARLRVTLGTQFAELVQAELDKHQLTAWKRGQRLVVRIHDSGDFYSLDYWKQWETILRANPYIEFYAYTKMIPMFERLKTKLPENFCLTYSEGGKADARINQAVHKHSRVFNSRAELLDAGYADASEFDWPAFDPTITKVGLVYHGAKSKTFTTKEVA